MKINWFSVFELFLTLNSAVIINLRALPHFPACLFNWIQEVLWKNSRNVESVICHVVWCCRPPTFKKVFFSSMAFAMDISMGFTMHIILTFGSMGFAMLTSMGFAMPSWHSWCTMYTEHFSSLDLSTASKWLHHCCSHPPPVPHPPQLPFVLSPPTICNLLKFRPVPPSFVDHGPKLRVLY